MYFLESADGNERLVVSRDRPLPTSEAGADNLNAGQVTVTGTSTEILEENPTRRSVLIRNMSETEIVFLKSSEVTTANGTPLYPLEGMVFETKTALYGIRGGSVNAVVAFVEEYD